MQTIAAKRRRRSTRAMMTAGQLIAEARSRRGTAVRRSQACSSGSWTWQ